MLNEIVDVVKRTRKALRNVALLNGCRVVRDVSLERPHQLNALIRAGNCRQIGRPVARSSSQDVLC